MSEEVELHPLVRALLSELTLSDGRVSLDDEQLASWKTKLSEVPDTERSGIATHLVAAAMKVHRLGGEAASQATSRLCELTALLIGTVAAAAVFEASDLPIERYAKVVGGDSVTRAPMANENKPPAPGRKPRRGLT